MSKAHMGQQSTRDWHEHAERCKRLEKLRRDGYEVYSGQKMYDLLEEMMRPTQQEIPTNG